MEKKQQNKGLSSYSRIRVMNYLFVSDFSCLIATCKSIKLGLLKKKKQKTRVDLFEHLKKK